MFSFGDIQPDSSTVKISINDRDVTAYSMVTGSFISFKPQDPLPEGANHVEVVFNDSLGNENRFSWQFTIEQENLILSVEHNGEYALIPGETLIVKAMGKPECTASFDIGHMRKKIPMDEKSPGSYEGSYTVIKGDNISNGNILVSFTGPNGSGKTMKALKTVDIEGRFFAVRIISPRAWSSPGRNFILKGRTTPSTNIQVNVQLAYDLGNTIWPLGQPTTDRTVSDEQGFFEYDLTFPVTVKRLLAIIRVNAVDAHGNRSIPDQITVYIGYTQKDIDRDMDGKN